MRAVRVRRLAIAQNQKAGAPVEPPLAVREEDGTERLAWGVSINGPSRLVWDENAGSPWGARANVHCWLETEAEVVLS